MNTPSPCDKCKHVYWNVMTEDDPNDSAECKLGDDVHNKHWGDSKCPFFQHWKLGDDEDYGDKTV